jgi:conjugative transfer signal peptidase TraF
MKSNLKRLFPLIVSLCVLAAFVLLFKFLSHRYLIQVSGSMPKGIYKIKAADNVSLGQIVVFNIPKSISGLVQKRRWAPERLTYLLMKPVAAKAGDRVLISEKGLFINDLYVGAVKRFDSAGRPLPVIDGEFVLRQNELFAVSSHDNSFDSRYFGPIQTSAVKGVVEPLIIF